METVSKIWFDGKIVDWQAAKIHVLTHSLHYGGAVFEGIRFYEAKKGIAVFRLKEHVDRLFYSAKVMDLKIPFTKQQISQAVKDIISKNKIKAGYIRPIVFSGYGKMGLNPFGADLNVMIAVWPWGAYLGEKAAKVKVSKYMRLHPRTTDLNAKISGHYSNSILASLEVHKAGYDEALLLDYQGNVAEGSGENIFMVKKGILYTPDSDSILKGITRNSVMILAKDLGILVKEKAITLNELKKADEVFFTGTAAEVTAIGQIDDQKIGDAKMGKITEQLKELYGRVVRGEVKKYEKWLGYIK